jgi:hypothetical protein
MESWKGPTLLGDFNLIRTQEEKNNGVVNFTHAGLDRKMGADGNQ